MSPYSTVHGGQYDTKYVAFEELLHAAFATDTIRGDELEPARSYPKRRHQEYHTRTHTHYPSQLMPSFAHPLAHVLGHDGDSVPAVHDSAVPESDHGVRILLHRVHLKGPPRSHPGVQGRLD